MLETIPFGSVVSWRIPPADLPFPNNVFDYAQLYFNESPETHASITMHEMLNWPIKKWYEFESSDTTRINRFSINPNSTIFDIFAPFDVKAKVIEKLLNAHYGKLYAIPQTFYFMVRWAAKKVGLDARKWINPFHWGKICSELVYDYLWEIAIEMKWYDLENLLSQWRADNFHAGDVRFVLNWMVTRHYAIIIYGV